LNLILRIAIKPILYFDPPKRAEYNYKHGKINGLIFGRKVRFTRARAPPH